MDHVKVMITKRDVIDQILCHLQVKNLSMLGSLSNLAHYCHTRLSATELSLIQQLARLDYSSNLAPAVLINQGPLLLFSVNRHNQLPDIT